MVRVYWWTSGCSSRFGRIFQGFPLVSDAVHISKWSILFRLLIVQISYPVPFKASLGRGSASDSKVSASSELVGLQELFTAGRRFFALLAGAVLLSVSESDPEGTTSRSSSSLWSAGSSWDRENLILETFAAGFGLLAGLTGVGTVTEQQFWPSLRA